VNAECYRIIDADYVFVGMRVYGAIARDAVHFLRQQEMRAGCVTLSSCAVMSLDVITMLAQVRAIGVLEPKTGRAISPVLKDLLHRAAAASDWFTPGRMPRLYTVTVERGTTKPTELQLIRLAKAMHSYQPPQLLLKADGDICPLPDPEFKDAAVVVLGK
jgi:hypothetical protein